MSRPKSMKLILEGWRKYVNKSEQLDENWKQWALGVGLGAAISNAAIRDKVIDLYQTIQQQVSQGVQPGVDAVKDTAGDVGDDIGDKVSDMGDDVGDTYDDFGDNLLGAYDAGKEKIKSMKPTPKPPQGARGEEVRQGKKMTVPMEEGWKQWAAGLGLGAALANPVVQQKVMDLYNNVRNEPQIQQQIQQKQDGYKDPRSLEDLDKAELMDLMQKYKNDKRKYAFFQAAQHLRMHTPNWKDNVTKTFEKVQKSLGQVGGENKYELKAFEDGLRAGALGYKYMVRR